MRERSGHAGILGGFSDRPGCWRAQSSNPRGHGRRYLLYRGAFRARYRKLAANSIEGFINGLVVLSLAEMPAEFAWQEAVGWSIEVEGCQVTDADEATPTVRCDVTHMNAISEWLGVGPYPGAYHLKVLFPGDEFLGVPITTTSVSESHQTEFGIRRG